MEENSFKGHCLVGFLSRFVETSANMADSRSARGRPRRPEGIKRLKLRESAYNMWIKRKEALGLNGISNNDFAEILLHQQLKHESVIDLLTLIEMILHLKCIKVKYWHGQPCTFLAAASIFTSENLQRVKLKLVTAVTTAN